MNKELALGGLLILAWVVWSGGGEGMTKGKFLPCESESPGFLMIPSKCSLIRRPLMSYLISHKLPEP